MDAMGSFFYQEFAPATATGDLETRAPIILLHDSLGSVSQWRDFPQRLADACHRRCIAYDRLGHGRSQPSAKTRDLSFIEREADFLLNRVLPETRADSFIAFGHSVGGAIAVLSAAKSGKRCAALITEGAQAFIEERTLDGIKTAKAGAAASRLVERLQRYHGEKSEAVLAAWTESWLNPQCASWSLQPWLSAVVAPTLVIHGDQDEFGSFRQPDMIASGVIGPAQKVLMEGVGHVPHRECPEKVLEVVSSFLAKLGR